MNKLARTGLKGDATDTPSISSKKLPLKMKSVSYVAELKICFNSFFVIFSCRLFSKVSATAISFASYRGILVRRLQTSYETKK